ncbi:MAG: AAA family ATPase [Clostridia bacterium]
MLTKIHIHNLLTFGDMSLNLCPGINLVVGENGTGKTQLLKWIYAFSDKYWPLSGNSETLRAQGPIGIFGIVFSAMLREKADGVCELSNEDGVLGRVNVTYGPPIQTRYDRSGHRSPPPILPAVFIPVKDMLTHANGLLAMSAKYTMPFDSTLLDIIETASAWALKDIPALGQAVLTQIETVIGGKVLYESDTFYVQKADGKKVHFYLEAEGYKKFALLWQLIMNGSIADGALVLWDEPDANINPRHIPVLVEILLALQRNGVQMVLTTHSYLFAKYMEVRKKADDHLLFHSLYQGEQGVACAKSETFGALAHNDIQTAFLDLLGEVYDMDMGD